MYISTEIAERIKKRAKEMGLALKDILQSAGLGQNTMAHMKTSMLKADSLAKIADCLNCSVDYLLGRPSAEIPIDCAELFAKYVLLDAVDKAKILERVDTLLEDDKYKKYISKPKEA